MVTSHDQDALYHHLTDTPGYLDLALCHWETAAAFVSDLETAIAAYTENTPRSVFRLAALHMLQGVLRRKSELTHTDDVRAQVLVDQLLERTGRRTQSELACAWLEPNLIHRAQRLAYILDALFECGGVIDEVLGLALRNLRDAPDPVTHLNHLGVISRAAAKHGRPVPDEVMHEAQRVMLRFSNQQSNWNVQEAFALVLADVGQLDAAIKIVQQMKDAASRAQAMNALVHNLASIGRAGEARTVAAQIGDAWRRDETLSNVVASLAQQGSFEEAEQTAALIMDLGKRTKVHALAATYQERRRNWQEKRKLSEDILELARTGQIEQAHRLAASLADAGERALLLAGIGFFAEARQIALDMPYRRKETLREIALQLARAGNSRASVLLDEAMQVVSYDSGSSAYTQYSFYAKIAKTLAGTDQIGLVYWAANVIDKEYSARLLGDAVQILCEVGDIALGEEVVWRIIDDEERDMQQSRLAVAAAKEHAKGGHVTQAFDLVRALRTPSDQDWGFSTISIAFAQAGDFDNAQRAAAEVNEGKLQCLGELAVLAASKGHPCEHLLWDTMKQSHESDSDPEGLGAFALAVYLIRAGHLQEGSIYLQEAYKAALQIEDPDFQVRRICELAVAWERVDTKRAQAVFDQARHLLRQQPNGNTLLAYALAKAGRYSEAWKVAHEEEFVKDETLAFVCSQIVKAGKLDDACRLAVTMPGYYERLGVQREIAEELGKQGEFAGPQGAFAALETKWLDDVIVPVCSGAQALEHIEEGLTLRVICEMARIGGWAEPRWKELYAFLAKELAVSSASMPD